MAVIFNSFWRHRKNGSVQVMPAPVDADTPDAPWHVDKVRMLAPELARAGFTGMLYPVLTKAQGGSAANADGYGKQFDYDLGNTSPTRWGHLEDLLRSVAASRAAGLMNLSDMVIHQYDGGDNGVYGEAMFPKHPSCFVGPPPRVPVDPVFDAEGNQAFGDMVAYVNGLPKHYMLEGMIKAIRFQMKLLDLDGYRLDDTKGENAAVSKQVIEATGGYVFGECFSGDPQELERWLAQTDRRAATLDFTLHFTLKAVCEGGSFRSLDRAGLVGIDPGSAVTFVDTADTDSNDFENIKVNKLWAYLVILTGEGTPLIFARDYLPDANCYGLKPSIDNLVWINRTFAFGKTQTRFVDDDAYVFTRDGDGGGFGWSGGLLVGMNRNPFTPRSLRVLTTFGANRQLHDYSGHAGDTWTDRDGFAEITIPQNVNGSGQSYVCYAVAGVENRIHAVPRSTSQVLIGDPKFTIKAARNGLQTLPYRIFCAAGKPATLSLRCDRRGWTEASELRASLRARDGSEVAHFRLSAASASGEAGKPAHSAWHDLVLLGTSLPVDGSSYELTVSYTGA